MSPLICIDPGMPARGYGSQEDRNLALGIAVADRLDGRYGVHMTRSSRAAPGLDQRAAAAREAAVFVTLSHSRGDQHGVWVHSNAPGRSKSLARALGHRLGGASLRQGPIDLLDPHVLGPDRAACLVDLGDGARIDHSADAIARALHGFLDSEGAYGGMAAPCGADDPALDPPAPARGMGLTDSLIIGGTQHTVPGATVLTWHDPSVHHFVGRARNHKIDELIIHESVTTSRTTTERVLVRRGLGVHLMIDPAGLITQHTDLERRVAHAGGHNARSIGVEVVNPYYPRHVPRGSTVWPTVIPARWAHRNQYVVPPQAQCEALCKLVEFLTSQSFQGSRPAVGIEIRRRWIGFDARRKRMRMGRVQGANRSATGVYAHHYFGHADGAFLALYCLLRLEANQAPSTAHANAVSLARGAGSWIDVSAHVP